MSQLALYLFGPPHLELDGNPVHIPRRKAIALVAYLAVTDQEHSRDSLATLLWPENNQSSARAELRRTLSVLKRTLGDGWLVTDRETARLNTHNDLPGVKIFWLDVAAFQEKLKICKAHNHPPPVTCPDCTPALEAAVELYNDDFMAGFSLKDCREYEEWQFFQGGKFRSQLINALVRLSLHYANVLEYETAIGHTRQWLTLDPLSEVAHRQLISLFSQSGQRAEALRQYKTCRQTLEDDLGVEPSEKTKELYQKIQANTLVRAAQLRPKSNLPAQATPFIGRVPELTEIRAKLKDDNCRLLTLLGPGGSGKTRLAIEAAGALLDEYKHGVFFVNLAPLEDAEQIPTTIAAALNFSFYEEGTPEEQLLDYLGNKQMLLILDNFEHLLTGVGYVNQIMNEAPGVKILATSRTSLDVSSEHIFDVWGMAYPKSLAVEKTTIEQYSAIKLFESAAKRRQASFELSDENIPDVIRICDLVEGMPLGIVLAASWAKMLAPKEIAAEIARDLTFLEKELQDLPERQWGMRSVFNHSWRLLNDREQKILAALSVFRGGFAREAAQVVAGASLSDLMGLIDKSILHRTTNGRFEIHELLRQYAAKKLATDSDVETAVRDKHGNYYWQTLANCESDLEGPLQGIAMKEITTEIDNIRAALKWGVGRMEVNKDISALNSLGTFHNLQTLYIEGQKSFQLVTNKLIPTQTFTKHTALSSEKNHSLQVETLKLWIVALIWNSFFNHLLGNNEFAKSQIQISLTQIEKSKMILRDKVMLRAAALNTLSFVVGSESRDEAIRLQQESVKLFKSLDLNFHVGYVLQNLGVYAKTREERIAYFEESLAVRRKQGDLGGIAATLGYLSEEAANMCRYKQAEEMANESLNIYKDISYRHGVVNSTRQLGFTYLLQGKFQLARAVQHETLSLFRDLIPSPTWALAIASAGFADLFLGDYDIACRQAQNTVALCNGKLHIWYILGSAHAKSILGRIALTNVSYAEARHWFDESLAIYKKVLRNITYLVQDIIGQELACQGFVDRGLNQMNQAQGYFSEALRVSIEWESNSSLFHTLPGIALLFADQGAIERSLEIYALAATQGYVANSKWFDDIAGDEIAAVAEELPAEVAEAAKERGRGLDLWETAEGLLAELDEMGWSSTDQQPVVTTPKLETT